MSCADQASLVAAARRAAGGPPRQSPAQTPGQRRRKAPQGAALIQVRPDSAVQQPDRCPDRNDLIDCHVRPWQVVAASAHYVRLRPWTFPCRPRGTVRGTTRRIIPAQWVPSVQWTVPSVQLARVQPVSTLLVNGRSAVRSRSPAPRSGWVWTLCGSRFVERVLLAGAVWQHSYCRHGRWRWSRYAHQEWSSGTDAGFMWINAVPVQIWN